MTGSFEATPQSRDASAPGAEIWLLSFGDLVSQMLMFFVMLYAMGSMQSEKFDAVARSFSQRFDISGDVSYSQPTNDLAIPKATISHGRSLDYLRALLRDRLTRTPALSGLTLSALDDRLVLSLPEAGLFADRSSELSERGQARLAALAEILANLQNRIDVNAHNALEAGARPADGGDWSRSSARAYAVALGLAEAGYDRPIGAYGFADSRAEDISPALPPGMRRHLANRIDIVIRQARAAEIDHAQ